MRIPLRQINSFDKSIVALDVLTAIHAGEAG